MLSEVVRFSKWLLRRGPNASTHIHYKNDLDLFFKWADKPPARITIRDINAYIGHCQELGHAATTINRRLAAIRSFYQFLGIAFDDAPPNPVIPKRHFIRQGRRLPRDAEDAEIQQLLDVVDSTRDRAIFLLMLRCGLRVGEVRNLSLGDLYLQPASGSLPRLWLRGKNGSQRVAYLSNQALTALEDWLEIRPTANDQAVFPSRLGRRMTVTAIQLRLAHYCRRAGVWITCHQFRHTFARHLIEVGVPVTSVQRLLGHARIRTTELYTHISDRKIQADYEAAMVVIDEYFSSDRGAQ